MKHTDVFHHFPNQNYCGVYMSLTALHISASIVFEIVKI